MIRIDWDTEITGKPHCLDTRSAVRCRVPVSSVGIDASGTSCTPARRILVLSLSRMSAPSSLHSSRSRCRGELDVQHEAAGAHRLDGLVHAEDDEPARVSAQDALQTVRRAVPGATALRDERISASLPELPPDFPGCDPRSLAATALLRLVRMGETRAKSSDPTPTRAAPTARTCWAGHPPGVRPGQRR